jgi:hypothetical protein
MIDILINIEDPIEIGSMTTGAQGPPGPPGPPGGGSFTYVFGSTFEHDIMLTEIDFQPNGCFFYNQNGNIVSVIYQIMADRIKILSTINLLNHVIKVV